MEKKQAYFARLGDLFQEYQKAIIVECDNVGSLQMQSIRKSLRGSAVMLMGKNTMIRKVMSIYAQENPDILNLLPYIKGNIGFIFTNDDLADVKKVVIDSKVEAPAKAGAIAPVDVVIPAGNSGLEPTQTSFLQAINIATKITRGTIEILQDTKIISVGDKVGNSEAALLQKLNINPFFYGLKIKIIYDNGSVYDSKVLDLTDDDLQVKFFEGLQNVASASLGANFPTTASLPHMIINGYKKVLSIAMGTEYSFKQADAIKEILSDPEKMAALAAQSAAPAAEEEKEEEAVVEEEEEEEESDDDMGFGLFD